VAVSLQLTHHLELVFREQLRVHLAELEVAGDRVGRLR
jgi:hypothetical protein